MASQTERTAEAGPVREAAANARLVSAAPGRIRVRVDRTARRDGVMAGLVERLREREGITDCETTPMTGSILVHYDRRKLEPREVLDLLRGAGLTIDDDRAARRSAGLRPTPRSKTSATILNALNAADYRLSRTTGRALDAKTAAPLALGGLGVWLIAQNGLMLSQIPGPQLIITAMQLFYTYNVQQMWQDAPNTRERYAERDEEA